LPRFIMTGEARPQAESARASAPRGSVGLRDSAAGYFAAKGRGARAWRISRRALRLDPKNSAAARQFWQWRVVHGEGDRNTVPRSWPRRRQRSRTVFSPDGRRITNGQRGKTDARVGCKTVLRSEKPMPPRGCNSSSQRMFSPRPGAAQLPPEQRSPPPRPYADAVTGTKRWSAPMGTSNRSRCRLQFHRVRGCEEIYEAAASKCPCGWR